MTNKTNKSMVLPILLAFLINMITFSAQASFFDWFSGTKIEYSSKLLAFGGISNDTGLNFLNEPEDSQSNLQLLQSNSILAVYDPSTSKKVAKSQTKTYVVPASAYSSTVDQTDHTPFITALGTHVRDGVIAANFLPFGTVIKIPELYGNRIFVVEDRMNQRYFYKIDIWFPNREAAKEFGVKKVKIEIVS